MRRGVPIRQSPQGLWRANGAGNRALDAGATYRTVYTVRFHDAIYVLHAFQKKSKHGIATPQKEMDLVEQRLAVVEASDRGRQD